MHFLFGDNQNYDFLFDLIIIYYNLSDDYQKICRKLDFYLQSDERHMNAILWFSTYLISFFIFIGITVYQLYSSIYLIIFILAILFIFKFEYLKIYPDGHSKIIFEEFVIIIMVTIPYFALPTLPILFKNDDLISYFMLYAVNLCYFFISEKYLDKTIIRNNNYLIKKLPKYLYQENNQIENDNTKYLINDNICAICRVQYQKNDELRYLDCAHHFHCECLDSWISINDTCPFCRRKITN